ncbi:MAG: four helix bundle protein [Patescibacteria group bacterium]
MKEQQNTNRYRDLEDRTTRFATNVIILCRKLSKNSINNPLVNQIVRSSGSVGANYREANEALGKKDFIYRMRITRKECKESDHWLQLIGVANQEFSAEILPLAIECAELRNIFSAILVKTQS